MHPDTFFVRIPRKFQIEEEKQQKKEEWTYLIEKVQLLRFRKSVSVFRK